LVPTFNFPLLPFYFKRFLLKFFFFKEKEKKEKKKKTIDKKKNAKKGENFPSNSCYALSLVAPTSTLLFQTFSRTIFFFSSRRKEKKNHKEEKKCREGRELTFKLSFCPFTFDSRF